MIRVTLYSRPGCHLCEVVEQLLHHVRKNRAFELDVRDIDHDPAELAKYKDDIPVIAVNGEEIARHNLTAAAFEAAVDKVG